MWNLIYMVLVLMILTSFSLSIYNTVREYSDLHKVSHAVQPSDTSRAAATTYHDKFVKIVFDNKVSWLEETRPFFATNYWKIFNSQTYSYQTVFGNYYQYHLNTLDFGKKDPSFTLTSETSKLDFSKINFQSIRVLGATASTSDFSRIGVLNISVESKSKLKATFAADAEVTLTDYTYLQFDALLGMTDLQ